MDSYPANSLGHAQLYQGNYVSSRLDSSFKVDEGYSEETRSQDDIESPMKIEPGAEEMAPIHVPVVAGLPQEIMALSEAERSGMLSILRGAPNTLDAGS